MERRAKYSMAGQRLEYTPATEFAAELQMELRTVEAYANSLRAQIKSLLPKKGGHMERRLAQMRGDARKRFEEQPREIRVEPSMFKRFTKPNSIMMARHLERLQGKR